MKITKKEWKWVKGLFIGALGWMFIVKPFTSMLDSILPNSGIRVILGALIILSVLYLWDIN